MAKQYLKTVVVTLQANQREPVHIPGEYLRVQEAAESVRVTAGDTLDAKLRAGDAIAARWDRDLALESDTAQTVTLQVGTAELVGSRVVGDVQATIDQPATGSASSATVTDTAAALVSQDAGRQVLHIRNTAGADLYLGPPGVTPDTAPVMVEPGGEYREADAAPMEWHGVCVAGQSTTAAIMEA